MKEITFQKGHRFHNKGIIFKNSQRDLIDFYIRTNKNIGKCGDNNLGDKIQINCILGDNGAGKSCLLREIYDREKDCAILDDFFFGSPNLDISINREIIKKSVSEGFDSSFHRAVYEFLYINGIYQKSLSDYILGNKKEISLKIEYKKDWYKNYGGEYINFGPSQYHIHRHPNDPPDPAINQKLQPNIELFEYLKKDKILTNKMEIWLKLGDLFLFSLDKNYLVRSSCDLLYYFFENVPRLKKLEPDFVNYLKQVSELSDDEWHVFIKNYRDDSDLTAGIFLKYLLKKYLDSGNPEGGHSTDSEVDNLFSCINSRSEDSVNSNIEVGGRLNDIHSKILDSGCFDCQILINGIGFTTLSGGQKTILIRFSSIGNRIKELLISGKKDIIILIDEPDLHLHLDWQRQYIKMLIDIFSTFICNDSSVRLHFILATHSPFIVSDLPGENIIRIRKNPDGEITFSEYGANDGKEKKSSFGANYIDIIQEGFFDNRLLMGSFAEEVILNLSLAEKIKILGKNFKSSPDTERVESYLDNGENKLKIDSLKNEIGDDFIKNNLLYF